MPFAESFSVDPNLPQLFQSQPVAFSLESTLAELTLHQFQRSPQHLTRDVVEIFGQYPMLPGVVLLQDDRLLGLLSRQRLLNSLILPQGQDLFGDRPLSVLYRYVQRPGLVLPADTPIIVAAAQTLRRSPEQQGEPILVQTSDGTYRMLDVHELNIAYWQIRGIETQVRYERTQMQLIQSEKMANLGRLVDGVAHEILDPVGFIWGNLTHLSSYTDQLFQLMDAYEACLPTLPSHVLALQDDIELDYLKQDLPQTMASIRSGAERLKALAGSLQNFCHIDEVYPKPADLHECLDSIILLLKSRLTGGIVIERQYGHLPPVSCFVGLLGQVFMNILMNGVNALLNQAIQQDLAGTLGPATNVDGGMAAEAPQITITTRVCRPPAGSTADSGGRWVCIRIANNGPGLLPEEQQHILESFSVKHRAAKETSLAVSYQIVTAKHGGQFTMRSPLIPPTDLQPGRGTEFEICLPLS